MKVCFGVFLVYASEMCCNGLLEFMETGFSGYDARRERVQIKEGAEKNVTSLEMCPARRRWRDGQLIRVALSGRPGQVGAWARSLDGEVGSYEARAPPSNTCLYSRLV